MFSGSIVALITPFRDGAVDFPALKKLVEFHLQRGTKGLVPCGTTGESATLTHEEHHQIIARTVEYAAGRIPVIAGTGSNSTAEAIALTREAKKAGANGALLITPYYNKPTQQGLYLHFKAVAEAVELPLVLYNVPGRTAVNLLPETVARLAELPTVVGLKEASGNITQIAEIAALCGDRLAILSGDDAMLLPVLALGGAGVISVAANLVPDRVQAIIDEWNAGRLAEARARHLALLPLMQAIFLETNPIPVKAAAARLGLCGGEIRLPLTPATPKTVEKLDALLRALGALK